MPGQPDPDETTPVDITAFLDPPWPTSPPLTPRPGLFSTRPQPRRRRIFTKRHRNEPTPGSRA